MPMFDDPKEALQQLEQQLLQEEEWFDSELEFAKRLIGEDAAEQPRAAVRNYANGYGRDVSRLARTYEEYDEDLDDQTAPRRSGLVRFLTTVAVLETLGILAIVGYWLRYLL